MNTRALFVENLSPRQLMAIDVAEIEPNNSESQATSFQFSAAESTVLRGSSSSQNDKDYFAFTAIASGPVTVGVNSNAGAKLEVTTRAGAQLFETEPKDGVNSGTFQTVAGTFYLLRMRAPDKAAATYAVTVSGGATGNSGSNSGGSTGGGSTGNTNSTVVEAEPNNDASQAVQLSLVANEPRTLTGVASKKDRDFFIVTPTSSGTVSIDTGNSGIKLSIETRQGSKLFESEPNDGVTQGSFTVTEGQVLVLRARGLNSAPTNYSIAVSLSGATSGATNGTTTTGGAAAVPTAKAVPVQWLDTSDDGLVSPLDALLVINQLTTEHPEAHGAVHSAAHDAAMLQFDMNDDSLVSPIDALLVINHLSGHHRGSDDLQPEGESGRTKSPAAGNDDLTETEIHRNRRRGR
ncbi:MAG: hypothetical protein SFV81_14290 [Pirellulaceae bacterium]|nr:hypothetical protein [Pirellulaceae bacterium]